jgi:hypothetical protein
VHRLEQQSPFALQLLPAVEQPVLSGTHSLAVHFPLQQVALSVHAW